MGIAAAAQGGVLTVTLDRPAKRNALTTAMLAELRETIAGSDARVMVLTGAGGVFSAGADLTEIEERGLSGSPLWEAVSGAVAGFRGLSVAAVNGVAAGGALGMVLACDLRVAVPGAVFFYPVMRMGLLPPPSDPRRLKALVGPARAKLILMAGQRIGAEEALAMGLVDRIAEDPVAEALLLAGEALAAAPEQTAAIKGMAG